MSNIIVIYDNDYYIVLLYHLYISYPLLCHGLQENAEIYLLQVFIFFFRTPTIVLTYAERPQILPFFSFSFSLIFLTETSVGMGIILNKWYSKAILGESWIKFIILIDILRKCSKEKGSLSWYIRKILKCFNVLWECDVDVLRKT